MIWVRRGSQNPLRPRPVLRLLLIQALAQEWRQEIKERVLWSFKKIMFGFQQKNWKIRKNRAWKGPNDLNNLSLHRKFFLNMSWTAIMLKRHQLDPSFTCKLQRQIQKIVCRHLTPLFFSFVLDFFFRSPDAVSYGSLELVPLDPSPCALAGNSVFVISYNAISVISYLFSNLQRWTKISHNDSWGSSEEHGPPWCTGICRSLLF